MNFFIYLFTLFVFLLSVGVLAQGDSSPSITQIETQKESTKSEVNETKKEEEEQVEKISVVGSHIRRLDAGPSPVHTITREDIEKSGYNMVGSILRDSTLSPYGEGESQISVRGLGAENTLVLVNGKRLPKQGSFYGNRAPNVNAIPTSVVERIEVLTDGASAIYGSEALAAVINIITRKDLNGVSTSAKLDVTGPEGGNSLKTSLTYGQRFSKGHFNTSFEYLHQTSRFSKDLHYINAKSLKRPWTSDNYQTPDIRDTAFENCKERDERGRCTQYYGHILRSGSIHIASTFSEVNYLIGPDLTFKSDLTARYTQGNDYGPTYMKLEFAPNEVPSWGLKLKGVNPEDSLIITHRVQSLKSHFTDEVYTFGANVGVEGDVHYKDWAWSLNNHVAMNRAVDIYRNLALKNESKQAMQSGRYNPTSESARDMRGMFHSPVSTTNYLLNTLDLSADGTLIDGGKTIVSMAAGAQVGYHEYKETADEQVENGNTSRLRGVTGSGQRSQQSVYTELGALFSNWAEVQLAARYDNYSDFGSTVNPKLALKIQPLNGLMLRGSVGTGFKAPELADINTGTIQAYLYLLDYPKCMENPSSTNEYCKPRSYEIETGGNPDLEEETSFSYNVGIGIQPSSHLHFSVGYWYYRINNLISSSGSVQEALQLQAKRGLDPMDYGIQIIRDEDGDEDIDRIIAPNKNLGVLEKYGLDFKTRLIWGLGSLDVDASFVLKDQSASFEGYGFHSTLGDYGLPRYRYTMTYNQALPGNKYHLQLKRRTTGRYKNIDESDKIPGHSQYDVFFKWSEAPFDGELTVGAINAFNSRPKFDPLASPHVDTSLYRGFATYYMGYKARF